MDVVLILCFMVVLAVSCSHDDALVTVITQLIISCALFALIAIWISRSAVSTHTAAAAMAGTLASDDFVLLPPCQPVAVNVWRSLSFLGGGAGSIIALIAHAYPAAIGADKKICSIRWCHVIPSYHWYHMVFCQISTSETNSH